MPHEIDLLLSCGCIRLERIEATIFIPQRGENRQCMKHSRQATILKVGQPYWVSDDTQETQPKIPKKNLKK